MRLSKLTRRSLTRSSKKNSENSMPPSSPTNITSCTTGKSVNTSIIEKETKKKKPNVATPTKPETISKPEECFTFQDDDEDEDDEAALMAELAKIKAEREAVKKEEEQEQAARDEEKLEEAALLGNPLLAAGSNNSNSSGRLKRRWNEDVVFRNQAKGEPEIKKRFINDTVRNDFHKRFLNKFIR
mmetsp:Transcript_8616/g.10004  ORF Transcript_8616/g.10004 Transcript_8616/m.10004 type:complete len:185 (+) Transcript_8616:73-627(+)